MSLKTSPFEGGVQVIALAPASIVSRMESSVGPPVAMIGKSGNSLLIFLTTFAAVSYTHLDVYKRQAEDIPEKLQRQW